MSLRSRRWIGRGQLWAVAVGLVGAGCSSVGQGQRPIDSRPVVFVDAKSGAPVERVLIIPKYGASTGVSTGAGHGPGYMRESAFLAFPFVYVAGRPFAVTQPDSNGVLVGPATLFVGKGVTVGGVVAVTPGYQAAWVWRLWDRSPDAKVPLDPVDAGVESDTQRWLRLLSSAKVRGADLGEKERRLLSLAPDGELDVRFSDDERQMIAGFLQNRTALTPRSGTRKKERPLGRTGGQWETNSPHEESTQGRAAIAPSADALNAGRELRPAGQVHPRAARRAALPQRPWCVFGFPCDNARPPATFTRRSTRHSAPSA